MIRSFILILSFAASIGIAWNNAMVSQSRNITVEGIWVCEDPSASSAEWLTAKDTLQIKADGKYTWRQGTLTEAGKWKLMQNKELQLFDRKNTFYQQRYHTRETSILHVPVAGCNEKYLALNFYSDDQSSNRIYRRQNN